MVLVYIVVRYGMSYTIQFQLYQLYVSFLFTGVHYKKMFQKAKKASTEPLFNTTMKEIQLLNLATFAYLLDKNPKSWSRTFFVEGWMCDVVENG